MELLSEHAGVMLDYLVIDWRAWGCPWLRFYVGRAPSLCSFELLVDVPFFRFQVWLTVPAAFRPPARYLPWKNYTVQTQGMGDLIEKMRKAFAACRFSPDATPGVISLPVRAGRS